MVTVVISQLGPEKSDACLGIEQLTRVTLAIDWLSFQAEPGGIRVASEEKHQRTTTKELWEQKCSHGHLICFVKKESLSGNTDMIRTGQNGRRQNSMRFLATLCVFLFSSCVSLA